MITVATKAAANSKTRSTRGQRWASAPIAPIVIPASAEASTSRCSGLELGEFSQVQPAGLEAQNHQPLREPRADSQREARRQHVDLQRDAAGDRNVEQDLLERIRRQPGLMQAAPEREQQFRAVVACRVHAAKVFGAGRLPGLPTPR